MARNKESVHLGFQVLSIVAFAILGITLTIAGGIMIITSNFASFPENMAKLSIGVFVMVIAIAFFEMGKLLNGFGDE